MDLTEKFEIAFSLLFNLGCYLALVGMNFFLVRKTGRKAFVLLAVGFGIPLIQTLSMWFLPTLMAENFELFKILNQLNSLLHTISLGFLIAGFLCLFFGRNALAGPRQGTD